MTEEAWVAIIVALIGTGILTTMGKRIFDWITGKHKDEDSLIEQRNKEIRRANEIEGKLRLMREALGTHRSWCHKHHDTAFEDMPPFPK